MASTDANKHGLKVFLGHSPLDKPKVRELYSRLKQEDLEPWLDEEDLLPGQNWEQEIRKAVRASDVVLVCLSKSAISREGSLHREIKLALDVAEEKVEGSIFVIPVRLEECELPERLKPFQAVNFYEERGYERLIKALRVKAGTLDIAVEKSPVEIKGEASREAEAAKTGEPPATSGPSMKELRQLLESRFSLEELRTLCFDLEVDYESLPGEGKAGKARELIAYMQRRQRLPELLREVQAALG